MQVIGQPLFKRWAKLMGEEHWLTDPRFKDDISRGDNGAVISERMSRWCTQYSTTEALDILMEAVPRHIDLDELRRALEDIPGATDVHDLHVWSLSTGRYALSAHAVVEDGNERDHVLHEMTDRLATRFDITQVTIQLECRDRRIGEPAHAH